MPAYVTFGDELPVYTLQQLLAGVPEDDIEPTRVVKVPGTNYRYTNADYAILDQGESDHLQIKGRKLQLIDLDHRVLSLLPV